MALALANLGAKHSFSGEIVFLHQSKGCAA
jgi:hypothetical protein